VPGTQAFGNSGELVGVPLMAFRLLRQSKRFRKAIKRPFADLLVELQF
jgi:hypothetical protein